MGLNKRIISWLVVIFGILEVNAQDHYYFVRFTDKQAQVQAALSDRAIQRRKNQHLVIESTDLPVNPDYVAAIHNSTGISPLLVSKWQNGTLIIGNKKAVLKLRNKPFIQEILDLGSVISTFSSDSISASNCMQAFKTEALDYGNAGLQISHMEMNKMHDLQLNGKGRYIAIFDGGFSNANQAASLTHLFHYQQIKFTHNVLNRSAEVYDRHTHGTNVLSCLAGYAPGSLVGPAYGADYALFLSEDVSGEKLVEEYYWMRAAEMADSIGVDIISSSLGYYSFDNSAEDHVFNQLDGKTAIITRAAQLAARKGILVVNSAGNNYADNSWRSIVFPCDGDSVLAVGAVNQDFEKAAFSAVGPTADKRLKPDVSALGTGIYINNSGNSFYTGQGTSYSAPLVAGFAAGLWQADTSMTNMEVFQTIVASASVYSHPTNEIGHGIPQFSKAYEMLKGKIQGLERTPQSFEYQNVYPNPVLNVLTLTDLDLFSEQEFIVSEVNGREILSGKIGDSYNGNMTIDLTPLPAGLYFLKLNERIFKIVKR